MAKSKQLRIEELHAETEVLKAELKKALTEAKRHKTRAKNFQAQVIAVRDDAKNARAKDANENSRRQSGHIL